MANDQQPHLIGFQNEACADFTLPENRAAMEAALAHARSQFGREWKLLIGGKCVETGATFASTNPARLIDFYIDVVGFTLSDRVLDDEGGLRTAFVRCGHEHHNLAVFLAPENRIDHHCLEAGDWDLIRDWSDHFADERIPLRWGPGRHGPGNNLFVFVHDLDGNWVEISAELEQVTPDRPVGNWPHEERTLNSWGIGLLRS